MIFKKLFIVGTLFSSLNAFADVGYHTGQQTVLAAEWWQKNLPDTLYVSNPQFNRPKNDDEVSAWKELKIQTINEPCFGESLRRAAQHVEQAGEPVCYGIDTFVIGQLPKTIPLLLTQLNENGLKSIADRIDGFVNDLQKTQINTQEEWELFLTMHKLPKHMELDFNLYLKNFDLHNELTDELLTQINDFMITDKDGKQVSLKDESIRWLSKVDFRPIGCFTDVVNYLEIQGELPSVLMMDAEGDDRGVLAILLDAHEKRGTQLRVVVQLPTDERADFIEKIYSDLDYKILRDPASRNIEALLNVYKR